MHSRGYLSLRAETTDLITEQPGVAPDLQKSQRFGTGSGRHTQRGYAPDVCDESTIRLITGITEWIILFRHSPTSSNCARRVLPRHRPSPVCDVEQSRSGRCGFVGEWPVFCRGDFCAWPPRKATSTPLTGVPCQLDAHLKRVDFYDHQETLEESQTKTHSSHG